MEGKVALEEHFSTELNNRHWNAKSEEDRNGKAYAQDVERRLVDPGLCVAEMDRCGTARPGEVSESMQRSIEAVVQIGAERVLFSVDYPYEQMDMGARWFDVPPRQRGCEFGVVISARTAARRSSERSGMLDAPGRPAAQILLHRRVSWLRNCWRVIG
jgi:hypothetical protein